MKTESILPFRPRKLISLWDMIQILAVGLTHNWQWLRGEKNNAWEMHHVGQKTPTQIDLNRLKGLLVNGNGMLKGWLYYCELLEMDKSEGRINHFFGQLNISNHTPSFDVIHSELMGLENAIWEELLDKKLVYIPASSTNFFEQDKLFGEIIYNAFPEARHDIKDAGNCIASDLSTAAVFHLMRVVELGLRKLASRLKSKTLIKKLKQTKIPIELGTWDEIISTLETKLDGLRKLTRSPKREQEIETCNELLKEFRSVKDLWRNKVMHTRAIYDAAQARSAFNHVCNFMQKIEKF